jgi:transposase
VTPLRHDRGSLFRQVARFWHAVYTKRFTPSAPELAAELGVSKRTAYRYLRAAEEAGWPLRRRGDVEVVE